MHDNDKEVIIIGAGISGLVCAYRLHGLGISYLLVENAARVGGVIQSEKRGDYLIERGPNSMRGIPELLSLTEELGIRDEVIEGDPKAAAYVFFDGRLRAVPMGPAALIKSDLLSARGKLRLLKEPFIPRRASGDEESVASFIDRRLGHEVTERLVAPFVSGIYAGDAYQLGIQSAFPHLASLELDQGSIFRGLLAKLRVSKRQGQSETKRRRVARSISFRSGMEVLTNSLASRLGENLRLRSEGRLQMTEVAALKDQQGKFRITLQSKKGEEKVHATHLVLATPAYIAAEFVKPLSEELSALLQEVKYPPLVVVHLAYDRSQIANPLDGFGFLVAANEPVNILGCIFNSTQFQNRAPQGKALLTIFLGGARHSDFAQRNDEELVSLTHAELSSILGITASPQVISITRWKHAIPQYNLGHALRVRQIEETAKAIDGLHLTGNYFHGVSVGDCLKEADLLTNRIRQSLGV